MNLRTKIFRFLRSNDKAVTLAQIKHGIDESPQAIQWQLKYLVTAGVVVKDKTEYFLQPFLYDLDITDAIFKTVAQCLIKHKIDFRKEAERGSNDIILEGLAIILDDVLCEAEEVLRVSRLT